MTYNTELLKAIWRKARVIEGLDPDMFRKDAGGALIMWDKFGKINPYGWEIDHIFPRSLGGDDTPVNLRAMHYKNNRSKGDDYPSYVALIRFDGNKNVEDMRPLTVNAKMRKQLKEIYKNA